MSHANIPARSSGAPFNSARAGAHPTGKTNEDQEFAQGPARPATATTSWFAARAASTSSTRPRRATRPARAEPPRRLLLGHHAKFSLTITIAGLDFRNAESFCPCCPDSRLPARVSPAIAADQSRPVEQAAPADKAENRLDKLFADLKRERNEKAAERIAGQIWEEWFKSGSASIDLMMMWAQQRDGAAEIRRRARFPRPGGHAVADLCRGLEPSRDGAFHDVELQQVDVRHRSDAAASSRAISARCPAWRRS